jgi:hypothetical protein
MRGTLCLDTRNLVLPRATGTGKPINFGLRIATTIYDFFSLVGFHTGKAGTGIRVHAETDFISGDLRPGIIGNSGGQGLNFLYSEGDFPPKIVAFNGTIRQFINMVIVHIEGIRHPPLAYSTQF